MSDTTLTTRQYAALGDEERDRILCDAMEAAKQARYTLGRYKAGEAAALLRRMFPGAARVTFDLCAPDEYVDIKAVYGRNGEVLFDLDRDEELPASDPEHYLLGAAEEGFTFRQRHDLYTFDLIDLH